LHRGAQRRHRDTQRTLKTVLTITVLTVNRGQIWKSLKRLWWGVLRIANTTLKRGAGTRFTSQAPQSSSALTKMIIPCNQFPVNPKQIEIAPRFSVVKQ